MAIFCMRLLGGFSISVMQGQKAVTRPVPRAAHPALAYLAYHSGRDERDRLNIVGPNYIDREKAAGLFAPPQLEAMTAKRNWLRKTLHRAFKMLKIDDQSPIDIDLIIERDSNDRMRLPSRSWSLDVNEFNALKNSSEKSKLQELIALYRGDLLVGYDEEWIHEERKHLRDDCLVAIMRLSTLHYEQKEIAEAIEYACKANAIDPTHLFPYRRLMECHAELGNWNEVWDHYERCNRSLQGAGPEKLQDVTLLYEQLKSRSREQILQRRSGEIAPGITLNFHRMVADDLVQQGYRLWNERTEAKLRESIQCFLHALQHCPDDAHAKAAIANAYSLLGYYSFMKPLDARRAAGDYLDTIPESDSDLPQVQTARAWIATIYDRKWKSAEKLFLESKQADPSNPTTRQWHSFLLMILGRFAESQDEIAASYRYQEGVASPVISKSIGQRFHYDGRYAEAVGRFKESLDAHPRRCLTLYCLGQSYEQLALQAKIDDEPEAEELFYHSIDYFNKALHDPRLINYPSILAGLGHVYARFDRRSDAIAILEQLKERREDGGYVSPVAPATVHLGLGDHDQALDSLEVALEQKPGDLVLIGIDPRFEALRSEPRFAGVLDAIDVEHAWDSMSR